MGQRCSKGKSHLHSNTGSHQIRATAERTKTQQKEQNNLMIEIVEITPVKKTNYLFFIAGIDANQDYWFWQEEVNLAESPALKLKIGDTIPKPANAQKHDAWMCFSCGHINVIVLKRNLHCYQCGLN